LPAARAPAPRQSWRRALAVVAVIGLGVLAFLLPSFRRGTSLQSESESTAPRIAVLYFEDRTPDGGLRDFADGLTEELIHELSGVNAFRVISRNGVKPFRDRKVSFDSMLAVLRPTVVVDGNVERTGSRLRVQVGLVDAGTNTYLDSLSLEPAVSDFVTLERDLARQVAAALRKRMGREARLRGAAAGTGNDRARELVLKAERARDDAETLTDQTNARDLQTATDMLNRADSLLILAQRADPRWLRPLIERGWVTRDLSLLLVGPAHGAATRRSLHLAEEAVHRAPESAEALELRGSLLWQEVTEVQGAPSDSTRLRQAEVDLRKALDNDSTLPGAWATLSYLLWFKGNTAEAELVARRALREDPYLSDARGIYKQLFFSSLMLGDFREAGEWCRRGRLSFVKDWHFVECELTLMRHDPKAVPRPDSAWALVRTLEQMDPADKARGEGRAYHPIYRRLVAATISARAGQRAVAVLELARASRATAGDTTLQMDVLYDEAYLRLVLGERDRAASLLKQYLAARPMARDYLARDPLWKDLWPIE
jgi:TolB-like protein